MILCDTQIRERALLGMINPFSPKPVRTNNDGGKILSYGTSSYGYDVRLGRDFRIFTPISPTGQVIVDPKEFDVKAFVEHEGDNCIIPPHSFVLGSSLEYFNVPRDILVLAIGKSTYARCGLVVNVTPLEPEWRGHVTIEISNTTPLPARVYAYEGIAQFIFLQADQECETSYADKGGKYQDQKGLTLAKV